MRILFCNKYNYRFSGTECYLFDLMDRMSARGHDVALFSMAGQNTVRSEYERFFVKPIDFKDAAHWLKRISQAGHAIYSWEARRKLGGLLSEFRPDVAHVRNFYHHLSPSIFWELRKWRVPVVYHLNDFKLLCPNYNFVSHGRICERCKGGRYWNCLREDCYGGGRGAASVLAIEAWIHRWLRTYERCVDVLLAPSEFVREKLVEHGWPQDRIYVLPHCQQVDEDYTPPPCAPAPVLYFGRLSAEKGLAGLLRAMTKVPEIPLVLAGEGPLRPELEKLRDQLVLPNVEFVGHLGEEDLRTAIARSRFTVFPSLAYETLGKSILESYALGRAVVASDLGSRREFVRHRETGLLFPPNDVHALAKHIASLYSDQDLPERMGRAAHDFVRTRHNPEQHCAAMESLYGRTISLRIHQKAGVPTNRPVRVAFIGGRGVLAKYSGIEAYYEEVGPRLVDRGYDVTVYCRSYFTPRVDNHGGMRLVRLPTLRTKHLETFVHTLLSTLHALTQHYDVVHYHTLGPALFSWIPRLAGSRTAVTVQGLDWQRKKWGPLASWVLHMGERAAVRCPDLTMVVSHTLRQYFRSVYGVDTSYVANGARVRGIQPARQIREWGLTPGEYVLFLGRFSPEKNCHLLIEAFERAALSVSLVLAGGGLYHDHYTAELRHHASDRIRFLDYVSGEALQELLTNAMLFVLPSDLEGLSLALLEAMGAGLCVLASDIPENREVVEGAGFLFGRGDAADLAGMLRFLAASPEVRSEAGQRAQERIRALYDWDRITDAIASEYQRIAGIHFLPRPNAHALSDTHKNRGHAA